MIENLEFDKALNIILEIVDVCNEYVQSKKPWETKDNKVLYELVDSIKAVAIVRIPKNGLMFSKGCSTGLNTGSKKAILYLKIRMILYKFVGYLVAKNGL